MSNRKAVVCDSVKNEILQKKYNSWWLFFTFHYFLYAYFVSLLLAHFLDLSEKKKCFWWFFLKNKFSNIFGLKSVGEGSLIPLKIWKYLIKLLDKFGSFSFFSTTNITFPAVCKLCIYQCKFLVIMLHWISHYNKYYIKIPDQNLIKDTHREKTP